MESICLIFSLSNVGIRNDDQSRACEESSGLTHAEAPDEQNTDHFAIGCRLPLHPTPPFHRMPTSSS